MTEGTKPTLAILGGTGKEGSGLGFRWAHAGHKVILGSRAADKAQQAAEELNALLGKPMFEGADNETAARRADIAILTVPYAAQQSTIAPLKASLQGKILVDVTVPLIPPAVSRVQLPPGGSAVVAVQELLGADVKVVSAFQNVGAHHLKDLDFQVDCDVLVCGDDKEACETIIALAKSAGMKAFFAGPLANSVVAEALTSALIAINRRYKVPSAGIRITGVPD